MTQYVLGALLGWMDCGLETTSVRTTQLSEIQYTPPPKMLSGRTISIFEKGRKPVHKAQSDKNESQYWSLATTIAIRSRINVTVEPILCPDALVLPAIIRPKAISEPPISSQFLGRVSPRLVIYISGIRRPSTNSSSSRRLSKRAIPCRTTSTSLCFKKATTFACNDTCHHNRS